MILIGFFFFQAEDGIRDHCVTGVQTCALPISEESRFARIEDRAGEILDSREARLLGHGDLEPARSEPERQQLLQIGRASCRERGERSGGPEALITDTKSSASSSRTVS